MDARTLVWLLLSVQTVARAARAPHDPRVSTTYTLSTGMQAVQSVSIGEIARLLKIPSSRLKIPANSLGSMPNTANTPLRQALDVACRMRSGVERLAGVWREMPGDLELSAVLEVTRQLQRDSYRWLSAVAKTELPVSEDTLASVCLHWEALVISEEAEQSLMPFIRDLGLIVHYPLRKQITSVTISEIIKSYFSH